MAAEAPFRIEMSTREAFLAVLLVAAIIATVALAQAGVIQNPLTIGLLMTFAIGMIVVINILVSRGVISRGSMPLFYVFCLGLALILYGAIEKGYLPVAINYSASTTEVAITNAAFYVLLILALLGAPLAIYAAYKYKKGELKSPF